MDSGFLAKFIMNSFEKKIMDGIYSCGTISRSSILKDNISDIYITGLIDKKIIRKQAFKIGEKKIAIYTFTKFGERYYTEQTNKTLFFRCSSMEKMLALSYTYSNLSDEAKETWKSKDEWMCEEGETVVPDATFIQNKTKYGLSIMLKSEKKDFKKKKALVDFKLKHNIDKYYIKYY